MSEIAPDGVYVYQPKPPQADGRIYALGGLPFGARCDGLTREEADAFAQALNDIMWVTDTPAPLPPNPILETEVN